MAWLTRDQVKQIVCGALSEIANYDGDCEQYQIAEIDDQYLPDFGNSIQDKMNEQGFEVTLSIPIIKEKTTISDLINYVKSNQRRPIQ